MRAIDQCKTLQDFRDLVAIRHQWVDFKDFTDTYKNLIQGERHIMILADKASELYAKYKIKEAIKEYKKSLKAKKPTTTK